jgi:hypothetical protein
MADTVDVECPERITLGKAVAESISNVYTQTRAYKSAKDRKAETTQIAMGLQAARTAERAAERAYNDHVESHGCQKSVKRKANQA